MNNVTRREKFLGAIKNVLSGLLGTRPKPVTREEILLDDIATLLENGAGGTTDYSDLTNKPSINGVTLSGDKSLADLGSRFIITLTINGDSITADKTFDEIKAAYDAGKTVECTKDDFLRFELSGTDTDLDGSVSGFTFTTTTCSGYYERAFSISVKSNDIWHMGCLDTKFTDNYVAVGSQSLYGFFMLSMQQFLQAAVVNDGANTVGRYGSTDGDVLAEAQDFRNKIKTLRNGKAQPITIEFDHVAIPVSVRDEHYSIMFHIGATNSTTGGFVLYSADVIVAFSMSGGAVDAISLIVYGSAKFVAS